LVIFLCHEFAKTGYKSYMNKTNLVINTSVRTKVKHLWNTHNTNFVLIILLLLYFSYAIFIALNLKTGIIPDENTHFVVSKHFSTTIGIPPDVPETYTLGVYMEQHPYLYYWINGRIINILNFIFPSVSDWQMLVSLRVINTLYTLGMVIFCYLFSKELIKHKWWQLLPVFLLTNTIMFVFLAGGVNYDNLTNLFCMASLYFLVRVFNRQEFIFNSLAWMICIASGMLTKMTLLPLAIVMGIAWIIFIIINDKQVFPIKFKGKRGVVLGLILLLLIIGNLAIYGNNLVVYRSILPSCEAILSIEQCNLSPHIIRLNKYGLDHKLTISESIHLGYPGPIKYLFTIWIPILFSRIFGVGGHIIYYSLPVTLAHVFLFYWMVLITIIYWRKPTFINISLLVILLFYSLVLFLKNYDIELAYGFKTVALQGRYIFPVISIAYILLTKVLMDAPRKLIRIPALVLTLALYLYSGPLTFIMKFESIFVDWLIKY